eukprot:CCRYP_009610-RB/>CCRYP_009610-RB protein AED:0.03 eAED:0.03 QI:468/1/1/1/1/1/3/466/426
MERSCHSMRLRSRDNSNSNAGNDSRSVFGDVSNRQTKKSTADREEQTSKRAKPIRSSTNVNEEPTANSKRGREIASKAKAPAADTKPTLRASSRKSSSTTDDANNKNDKPSSKGRGAAKRITTDESNSQATSRSAKRAKIEAEPAVKRRSTRSRTSRDNVQKSKPFVVEEIPIITHPECIVPPDFRLQRASFDGQSFTHGIAHYDARDRSDPLLCKDYVTDIFQHFFLAESQTCPETYMQGQEDINAKMRAILVDWLVEVHMKFRLNPNTLYLCVNIIDRYCSRVEVRRSKLQLVGVTALLVACKHEEIYPPEVRDCVYITDRAYNRQEVLDMEQSILTELDWKISVPTAYPFLHRFLSLVEASTLASHAAHYYLERSLQEHDMLDYRPSEVAAAAVLLAINNPDVLLHDEDYEGVLPGMVRKLVP